MLSYSLNSISKLLDAKLYGNSELTIASVLIDSRKYFSSKNSLFIALVGEQHDGHRFIGELHSKGVVAFVVSRIDNYPELYPNASFIEVKNTLEALQKFATFHRSKFSYPVIGVTGSNGKTIVKEWLSQLLAPDKRVIRSPKSFNSQVGVPLSVFEMTSEYEMAILEAGISKPNEMVNLEKIIAPEIGIITNIGAAHQENFKDIESKAEEKMKLFANSKGLIYCKDHSLIDSLAKVQASNSDLQLFTWGKSNDADISLVEIEKIASKSRIILQHRENSFEFFIPFTDEASIENAMHCLCAMVYLGLDIYSISPRMSNLLPVAMRLELKEGVNGCTIINDSYNSDIGSLSIALDFLAQQRQHSKRMLIISDILQSGQKPESLYRDVAKLIGEKGVDKTIGIGQDIGRFKDYFPKNSEFFNTSQDFIDSFLRQSFRNTAILLKGSRPFQFEKISALLEQKTHRTVLEINLNALANNLNYFRGLLKPNVKVMVMVKAFSYGSGSHEIANILQFQRVDYLGVAFTDEGIALREAGITLPIVVLNPEFGSYDLMIEYNLEPEIFSFSSLKSFTTALEKQGITSYPVHLKIDTGMHRLGFEESDIPSLIQRLKGLPNIKVQSIFSHLVATDDSEHDGFTQNQIDRFKNLSEDISKAVGYKPLMHILNSAGIERFPNAQFDMIRLGIGLYGVSAIHQQNIQNVSSLKTFIAQLREVPAGETVGYNRKGKLTRLSMIATLPIGYADGLNRRLSNGIGKVMINGVLVPIVGNISMDTCMVDVTDLPKVEEGDEVIVFGENPTIIDLAMAMDTIPYEVLTSISRRVKRIYIQE